MARERNAFTLVELLVVVAILSVLAALLLPSLERALDDARLTLCINNQRQLAFALQSYAGNSNDYLISGGTNATTLLLLHDLQKGGYLEPSATYLCPGKLYPIRYYENSAWIWRAMSPEESVAKGYYGTATTESGYSYCLPKMLNHPRSYTVWQKHATLPRAWRLLSCYRIQENSTWSNFAAFFDDAYYPHRDERLALLRPDFSVESQMRPGSQWPFYSALYATGNKEAYYPFWKTWVPSLGG